jgi:hypothetical protein
MQWAADVKLAGPVGSMGQRVLQPIVNQQVAHVLTALDKQVQEAVASGASETRAATPQGAGDSSGGEGNAGHPAAPRTDVDAPASEGPKDYGPPADADQEPDPPQGTSGADEGVSPWAPEAYEPDPEGPTTSTEDKG